MKELTTFIFLLLFCYIQSFGQISANYPHDENIENDPKVLFVEKFDDGLTNILSRYDNRLNTEEMVLEKDLPSGSKDGFSLKMTCIQGENNGGHLYKSFTPGFDNVVYVRYYVKYHKSSKGYFHHESVWFGGYNPATKYPNPQAGVCGLGDSRISIAYEAQDSSSRGHQYPHIGTMSTGVICVIFRVICAMEI